MNKATVLKLMNSDLGAMSDCDKDCGLFKRKIMMFVSNDCKDPSCTPRTLEELNYARKNNKLWDFHFYRQDRDCTWSHKPGGLSSRRTDSSVKIITDPRNANRSWPGLLGGGYTQFIGCWCVGDTCP